MNIETFGSFPSDLESVVKLLESSGFVLLKLDKSNNKINGTSALDYIFNKYGIEPAEVCEKVFNILKGNQSKGGEELFQMQSKTGRLVWFQANFSENNNEILVILKDVTDEREILERGAEASMLIELFDKNIKGTYISIIDANSNNIIYSSTNVQEIWNIEKIPQKGDSGNSLIQGMINSVREDFGDAFIKYVSSEVDQEVLCPMIDPKGMQHWIAIRRFVIYNLDQTKRYFIDLSYDATESVRLQEELNNIEVWNEGLFSQLPDEIYHINNKGEVLNANNLSNTMLNLLSLNDLEKITKEIEELSDGVGSKSIELEIADGNRMKYFEIRFMSIPAKYSSLVMIRDITELKLSYEEKLKREVDRVIKCLSTIVHDMKGKLAVLKSSADLIEMIVSMSGSPDSKLERHSNKIQKAVDWLNETVEMYSHLGRVHNLGKFEISLEAVNIGGLINEIVEEQNEISTTHIMNTDIPQDSGIILADRKLLKHAFVNFVTNACKYSPQDSIVNVKVVNNGSLKIYFEDHGIGMTESEVKKIFEPFFRGSNVQGIHGTGIGMYIANMCIAAHGGNIQVESELGKGSTFIVNFQKQAVAEI